MICNYGCGQEAIHQFKNGKWCCSENYNACRSKKENRSEIMKEFWSRPGTREKLSERMKEVMSRPGKKENLSEVMKESQNRLEVKEKTSKRMIEVWNSLKHRENLIKSLKEGWKDPEVRKRQSKLKKEEWINKTDEEKEAMILKTFVSNGTKPNKTELLVDGMIQAIKLNEFEYVGDGQVLIAGKCPDWINVNGKKQLIEFFGDYWHGEKHRQEVYRDSKSNKEHELWYINHYKKYGFDCLVIWERELKDAYKLKSKLIGFIIKGGT